MLYSKFICCTVSLCILAAVLRLGLSTVYLCNLLLKINNYSLLFFIYFYSLKLVIKMNYYYYYYYSWSVEGLYQYLSLWAHNVDRRMICQ
jgi:hypothetical protein